VVVAEPGVHGVVVGLPHRRPQLTSEIVFDVRNGVGIGLPLRPSGSEDRLEYGECVGGFGPSLGSLGEVGGEFVAALLSLDAPWMEPIRDDRCRLKPAGLSESSQEVAMHLQPTYQRTATPPEGVKTNRDGPNDKAPQAIICAISQPGRDGHPHISVTGDERTGRSRARSTGQCGYN
jgi:hypothetical protein